MRLLWAVLRAACILRGSSRTRKALRSCIAALSLPIICSAWSCSIIQGCCTLPVCV